ncbi:MAG TPA: hypothetical protein DCW68_07765 [Rhodospirillaceae bacterium]|nr:MAG: hypothetical protein A2018_08015 [Alphaproteobacteria bacterium GWF2_58_20]HAU29984.1 hypothetical protein [Rhodospirillaceae bacterium]
MQEVRFMKHQAVFSLATALALVMAAGTAQAGFQWVPQPEVAKPAMMNAPVVEVIPAQDMAPVVEIDVPAIRPAPAMVPAAAPMAEEDLPPWLAKESPALPVVVEEEMTVPEVKGVIEAPVMAPVVAEEPALEGFGKNMPLVIAMRQIVPTDYQFAFGSGVNMGAAITWEGGKPWNVVLKSVLEPMGLGLRVVDKVVYVEKMENGRPVEGMFAAAVKARVSQEPPVMVEKPLIEALPAQPVVEVVSAMGEPMEEDELMPALGEAPELSFLPLPVVREVQEEIRVQPKWVIEPGRTLREVLEDWGQQADWVVVWRSERDYLIESGAIFEGAFAQVAEEVLQAFAHAEPPVRATFYRNKTLVIDAEAMSDLN